MADQAVVLSDEKLCEGCNKCIFKCPTQANDAKLVEGKNKIYINESRCIECGECISTCDHGARSFVDDTERFFEDLGAGKAISVIVAPAARVGALRMPQVFGYLKSLGVKLIYDVSYGADICTWAYMKAIRERKLRSILAQPCPVVVSYIEKCKPNLISYLAPIHSPAMCTAIYLHEYKKVTDAIAFLSPCLGKKVEFDDPNTKGAIN